MQTIIANLDAVRERIVAAAQRAGRNPASVRLVAVSKTVPAGRIRAAAEAGQTAFGENYAQELRDKARELSALGLEWHFIGHLQRNKARYVAQAAGWMETLDSAALAEELVLQLSRRASPLPGPLPCLIEVNVGGEASKSGVAPEAIPGLIEAVRSLPELDLRGLMTLPPFDPDPERSRPYFQRLRELQAQLNRTACAARPLTELSMGMSHDFEVAIEEGATIVRVGTAIFGER